MALIRAEDRIADELTPRTKNSRPERATLRPRKMTASLKRRALKRKVQK